MRGRRGRRLHWGESVDAPCHESTSRQLGLVLDAAWAYGRPSCTKSGGSMMEIQRISIENAGRNFNHLLACPESGEALAIDPLDTRLCLADAARRGWRIAQIVNDPRAWLPHRQQRRSGGRDRRSAARARRQRRPDSRRRPRTRRRRRDRGGELGAAPGVGYPGAHPRPCVPVRKAEADPPALFCGDTLFAAGAGNCRFGGHPELMYDYVLRHSGEPTGGDARVPRPRVLGQ